MQVERIQPDFSLLNEATSTPNNQNVAPNTTVVAGKDAPGSVAPIDKSEAAIAVSASASKEATKEVAKEQPVSKEELEKHVKTLNSAMEIFNRKFHFKIHDKTHRVIVQVLDSDTGQVISEIPPAKVLDMVADMQKAIGLVVDVKA